MKPPQIILFACVHNAGRSQMAAAFFNSTASGYKAVAISAGTEPGTEVHPEVISVMKETGIDLQNIKPQFLSDEIARKAHYLITMGCEESCPFVPGVIRKDWQLEDPKGKSIEKVREIRDQIKMLVEALVKENNWN
jgi:arsenate reductase